MSGIGRYDNPYRAVEFSGDPPAGTSSQIYSLATEDRAACHGVLWLPPGPRPRTVACLMHPRADFMRHYAVPGLLAAGLAVFTQNSRSVGNDSMLVHEALLLDVAAGIGHLRGLGFERIVPIGNSGGGSLYTFYVAQASTPPEQRLTRTPAGAPIDLGACALPNVDAMVYLAAHPGEGAFLMHAIDPSVTDEDDPCACDPALDMYGAGNGFRAPPQPSRYDDAFVVAYRAAQQARVERIDRRARELISTRVEARRRLKDDPSDVAALRAATAVRFLTVYRTEADLRYTDPSIDPSARDYGSLFGGRPDVINYGPFGFARVVTPDAWLSTWSGLSSNASLAKNAARVRVPALVIDYDADNAVFPSQGDATYASLASTDKERATVSGDHYGHPPAGGAAWGREQAIERIVEWLRARD